MAYSYGSLVSMQIRKTLSAVVSGLFCGFLLVACVDDGDKTGIEEGIDEPDATIIQEPDAMVVITPDAAPDDATVVEEPDAMPTPDAAAVSFSADLVPILLARCGGCHLKDVAGAGGLSFGVTAQLARSSLVDQDTVLANPVCGDLMRVDSVNRDPMQSSLYVKLLGATCGKRMPSGMTAVPLPDEQIELFRRWIEEGSPDN